ncbi:MAG: alpha/beta fold hydrolase [Pseudomonadota bacterium]
MIYAFDEFELDTAKVELRCNCNPVAIEPQVFALLHLLVENADRMVSRDEIIETVWKGRFISEAAVASRISMARSALGDDGKQQRYIKTVHGQGLIFRGQLNSAETPGTSIPSAPPPNNQMVRFCQASDGTRVAWARVGNGPPIVKAAQWLTHLDLDWTSPLDSEQLRRFSQTHEVIRYDGRGNGLSDWNISDLTFEHMVDDLEAVVDAAGCERFPLVGLSQGVAVAIEYAVRHPERVTHLVFHGGFSSGWNVTGSEQKIAEYNALETLLVTQWGSENASMRQLISTTFMPSANDEEIDWFNEFQKKTTSAQNVVMFMKAIGDIDVRDKLSRIKVPTLVTHSNDDQIVEIHQARELASCIPNAQFLGLNSEHHSLIDREPAMTEFLDAALAFIAQ